MKSITIFFVLLLLLNSCSDNIPISPKFEPVEVDIRMEVQILDSTYQMYAKPLTKIYFTTYVLRENSSIDFYNQSDTTSCSNGWGVKLLNYTLTSNKDKIILGASCDAFNGNNFREMIIDYQEVERRIDSTG